jgi:hypothetical protein
VQFFQAREAAPAGPTKHAISESELTGVRRDAIHSGGVYGAICSASARLFKLARVSSYLRLGDFVSGRISAVIRTKSVEGSIDALAVDHARDARVPLDICIWMQLRFQFHQRAAQCDACDYGPGTIEHYRRQSDIYAFHLGKWTYRRILRNEYGVLEWFTAICGREYDYQSDRARNFAFRRGQRGSRASHCFKSRTWRRSKPERCNFSYYACVAIRTGYQQYQPYHG